MKLGIVGGEGKMGRLFRPIFEKYVDEVLSSPDGVEIAKTADIIVFSVPIEVTPEVIEKTLPYIRKEQLLLDFTSLKEKPCHVMLKSKASVIGMHPMFGPSVPSLAHQTVVLCPERPGKWLPWLKGWLAEEKAHVIETDPKTHDEMMAIVQCLVHFTSLIFSETLRLKGIKPETLAAFASPVYRMQLHIAGRILRQSPDLYRAIQMENPQFPVVLESFQEAFHNLRQIVTEKDAKGFEAFFMKAGDYLGDPIKEEGQKMTNRFIQAMVEGG